MHEAIPVVKGPLKEDYLKQAPKKSFIHVDDFRTTQSLVEFMLNLSTNREEFNSYHNWRKEFRISVVHTRYLCELCEKLHESNERKSYINFDRWFNSCKNFTI